MIFWYKIKIYNFDLYNVFLAIATNIPQWLKTGFVVQGHIWLSAGVVNPVVRISTIFTLKGPSLSLNAHLKFIFKTNNN